ncbi:MAG: methionine adenosyltransferase [Peptoniphilaceae bacterium]|nr:methionine adenosyltransferase [Peptoniphilaceae bacterium]MDY5765405.1 methionine adenosyltransferase [Peptoniphilaceae bacterium]MDY6146070.1 methionine adenosyltransferase [Peptoniphilaceae bacterium]
MTYFFTSESVTEGHPDKVCDQIADAILDALLEHDPASHVACEVTAIPDGIHIFGEITSTAHVDYAEIARQVVRDIGYVKQGHGFDADTCQITVNIHEQSPDINMGVEKADSMENGAGDQGMMFGFACRETENLMPQPIEIAHALTKRLAFVRKDGILPYLLPDGKAQVTVEYRDGAPARVGAVVVSSQHEANISMEQLREDILGQVIRPVIPEKMSDEETRFFINPTGRFCIGGPAADSGLTGRKLIVDTYGGYARHGGGALSGKDPSKVDRSGAYMARYLAKNVVAAGIADRCEIQISYVIGVARPISILVNTFGTGKLPEDRIREMILSTVDLRPSAIIERLSLRTPFYRKTASYGHFGSNTEEFPWEQTDLKELWRDTLI